MKQILFNLALLDAINYCKSNNIDCSDTHLEKIGRGFTYGLYKNEGKLILITTFHKYAVPQHSIIKDN